MNRERVIATLQAHESELRAARILSLSVFGSTGRGDAGEGSDVDIAVLLAENFSPCGFDYFAHLERLEHQLSTMLGCDIDLIEEPVSKGRFQTKIDKDRTLAF